MVVLATGSYLLYVPTHLFMCFVSFYLLRAWATLFDLLNFSLSIMQEQ